MKLSKRRASLDGQHFADVEAFDFAGDLRCERSGIEAGDPRDAGLARDDVGPRLLDAVTGRTNRP
jgi:hypothetical protein